MRGAILTGLVITFTCLGCIHTHTVRTDSIRFAELRRRALSESATVVLASRQYYRDVRLTRMAPDSTAWRLQDGKIVYVPTEDIHEIRVVNKTRGGWQGLGLGVLGGALTGALVGLASGDDPEPQNFGEAIWWMSAREKAGLYALLLSPVGGLLGVVIGRSSGSTQIYRLEHPPALAPRTTHSHNNRVARNSARR
jgi:hypothetical protein